MSQDTRKDKRAKVVSLNVRYKSATVDEFIENHSHDVSKGGLFVKTPTPFPPGTLLKFEIRLAGDKSVISGVGRVVWKREPTQAGAEKPAGMGVKFIKIDDSSRAVIDRLIAQKADAGSAYNSEQFVDEAVPVGHPSTLRGLVAAPAVEPGLPPGPSPVTAPPPAAGGTSKLPVPPPPTAAAPPLAAPPPPAAKNPALAGTLAGPRPSGLPAVPPPAPSSKPALGGAPKPPPPRPAGPPGPPAPAANKPSTAVGVGPSSNRSPAPAATISAAAVPVEKPPSEPKLGAVRPPVPAPRKATMMGMPTPAPPKAEVPAAAPPATSATPAPAVARERTAEPMFPRLDPESGSEPARDQTVMKQAAELLEEALKEAGGSLDEIGQNPLFSQAGEAVQSGDTMIMSSPIPSGASPPSPLGDTHTHAHAARVEPASVIAASSPSQPLVFEAPASVSAPVVSASTRKVSDDLAAPKKKGGSAGPLVGLLVAALLVGGGVYAWQTGMLGGAIGPEKGPPSASTTAPPPPSSPPSAASVVPPVVATTDAATVAADAAATPAATTDAATSEGDAGKAATTTTAVAPPPPPPAPPKPPRPPAPPKPPPPPPVEPTATTEPTPPPAPTPTPAPTPATPPTPTMEPWTPP